MRFHTTTSMATNVTLNTSNALLYADTTFAATNFTLANGNNTFTAIARDGLGRVNTNSLTVNLPATNSYAYDLNGNLLTNGTEVLVYNDENELVTNFVAGSWKSEFVYDGKLRRRIERDYSWSGSAWTQTNEIRFVYDGNVVIQHRAANNAPLLTLTRWIDLSGTMFGAGGIGGLLAMTEGSGVSSFYHADGNGNITALVNASQILVGQAKYDSFGNFISLSGAKAGINGYWFSSKPIHWQSGKYDFLYRWYVPNLQRWPNRDPIGERGGLNLYRAMNNNPVNWIDPLGLSGTLTIDSSGTSGLGNHSWVSYTPDGGTTTTYGTWGNHYIDPATGLPSDNGLNTNFEQGYPADATRSAHLDDAQEAKFNKCVSDTKGKGSNGWSYGHPCSGFACDAWNGSTGEHLNPYWLGINNPTSLTGSITSANGGVANGTATPTTGGSSSYGGSSGNSSSGSLNSSVNPIGGSSHGSGSF